MFNVFIQRGTVAAIIIGLASACQSTSRNKRDALPPPQPVPGEELMTTMINKEIIPALQSARTGLTMLDSLRLGETRAETLASLFFDLEKSFKSTARPQASDAPANSTDSSTFYRFELPFVNGKSTETIIAKVAKDRAIGQSYYDVFGTASTSPRGSEGLDVMLSSFNEPIFGENFSIWIFDTPRLNTFFKKLYNSNVNLLDPDLSIEFTMSGDEHSLAVWTPEFQDAVGGLKWRQFSAKSNIKSPEKTSVSFLLSCGEKSETFNVDVDAKTLTAGFQKFILETSKLKLDPKCRKE